MSYATLCFDPGVNVIGFALFWEDRLRRAALWRADIMRAHDSIAHAINVELDRVSDEAMLGGEKVRAFIELPQTYGGRAAKGDANDQIAVAVVSGRIAQAVHASITDEVELIWPKSWKGTVDPEVMLKRIVKKLDERELITLKESGAPPYLEHNVIDAVGIGLKKLGRL